MNNLHLQHKDFATPKCLNESHINLNPDIENKADFH